MVTTVGAGVTEPAEDLPSPLVAVRGGRGLTTRLPRHVLFDRQGRRTNADDPGPARLTVKGEATVTGDGSETVWDWLHALGEVPDAVYVSHQNGLSNPKFSFDHDATKITVTFDSPLPSGVSKVMVWSALRHRGRT